MAASAAAVPAATEAGSSAAPSAAARRALFSAGVEQVPEVAAAVDGQLPAWLAGSLLVNGGGDYTRMQHMFDGYALLTKVRLDGAAGAAWGSQRYLDTRAYREYKAQGRVVYREFATRPEVSRPWGALAELLKQLAGLVRGAPDFTDNASVSLARVAGRGGRAALLAMSETPAATYLVDPDDLATLQQVAYSDGVRGDLTTAHPSLLSDGSLLNFSRTLPFGGMQLYRQDPATLTRTQVGFVPDRHPLSPAWLHDFAATDRHAVLIEHPLYMSLTALLLNTPCSHYFMDWVPEDEVRVTVVTLDGSQPPRLFMCPTFFFFHVGNAFESDDGASLCVDLAAYDDPTILHDLAIDPLTAPAAERGGGLARQVSASGYRRLTIPLAAGAGERLQAPEPLVPEAAHGSFCEFPAINPSNRGRPYRYVYCLSAVRPTNMGNALSKLDLTTGTAQTWHEPGAAVGEPAFVPRPGAAAEDDGVVLAPGVGADGRGFLAVLDAARFEQLARVQLPFGVPYRFHGLWLPQQS